MNIAAKKAVSLILSLAVLLSPTVYSGAFAARETTSLQTGGSGNSGEQYSMNLAQSLAEVAGPKITKQPEDHYVTLGTPVTFSVEATGSDLTYQWYKNGNLIYNETSPSLVISNPKARDCSYDYHVIVKNSGGSLESNHVVLMPTIPMIVGGALDGNLLDNAQVTVGDKVVFDMHPIGPKDMTFKWYKYSKGTPQEIPGATSSTYTIDSATSNDEGLYEAHITSGETLTIKSTTLTVNPLSAPTVNPVTCTDTTVTGRAKPGATVTVKLADGSSAGTATADSTGVFSVSISAQAIGTALTVTAVVNGNATPAASVSVGLPAPKVNPVKCKDTVVTGTTLPGATVTVEWLGMGLSVGSAKANSDGEFSVAISTALRANACLLVNAALNGQTSNYTDVTVSAPTAPKVNPVTQMDTTVTGTADPGADITIESEDGFTILGSGTADSTGAFSAGIVRQPAGSAFLVIASIGVNQSLETIVQVQTSTGSTVTGFAALDDTVKNQSVSAGAISSHLNFPKNLAVTGDGITGKLIYVTAWTCSNYNSSVAGTYTFHPTIDYHYTGEGYVESGFSVTGDLPTITVTVRSASPDSHKPIISGFADLGSALQNQSFSLSDLVPSLNFPDKLAVIGNGITGLWVKVSSWVCSALSFPAPGTYTFHAVLDSGYTGEGYVDSGYTLARLVNPPTINVTVKGGNSNNNSGSSGRSDHSSTPSQPTAPHTETQVNPAGNTATVTTVADSVTHTGDTAQIAVTVPSVTVDTTGTNASLNESQKASVSIELPKDAILQQLAAKKDVDLTLTVPHTVAQDTTPNLAVTIKASADIIAAAKASGNDVTIHIKDADTQQLAYSWTFQGADLAKSTVSVTDVNISMAIRLTTEVSQVNRVTPDNKGLVLMFDHSGVLPSVASVTFSAKEKGFQPGQKLYFYYYNPKTGQIDAQNQEYTVGPDGMVTVQIFHCSNYVLLPNKARTIVLDTRTYTLAPGQSYVTGVKLSGVSGSTIKAYSSTKGAADVTVLKNGNVKATGRNPGMTYIMIDVYDSKHKLLTHASVRLTVKSGVKPNGNSATQYGLF